MITEIQQARDHTIQSFPEASKTTGSYGVMALVKAGLLTSSWWSEKRDKELRNFWKKSDHLAGAIYNLTSKMTAIPFTIVSKDTSDKEKVAIANDLTSTMRASAQFGEGWQSFFSRFVEDLVSQDNGAFIEIIGPGKPTGPLTGSPWSFGHLDSARCQRTGDPEFPVLYRDDDQKLYKLHYTRVIAVAQMTSPIKQMNGVGFCAVSRCMNVAQTLIDILTFKQEKLGSRPHRAILVTKGGLDPKDVADAFQMAEDNMDAQGLSRYAKVVVTGSSAIEDAGIDKIELSEMPDGFDERTSIELGMASIALALGMDARELFPSMTAGATRADALVQHLKQRGRGPGQIIETVEAAFEYKYLPKGYKLVFDYQDDAQDRQAAETRRIRSEFVNIELINGVVQKRTARERMFAAGDIDRGQFDMMELMDGRLDDGTDVINIFYRDIPPLTKYMDIGVEDPLDFGANDAKACFLKIDEQIRELRKTVEKMKAGSRLYNYRMDALRLLSGLLKLKQIYAYIIEEEVTDQVEKIRAADDALSQIAAEPELGQRIIVPVDEEEEMLALAGKPGPRANTPRQGNRFNRSDPSMPSGNREMQQPDMTKPRSDDRKEIEDG